MSKTPATTDVDIALFGRVLYELSTGDALLSDSIDFVGAPEPSLLLLDLLRHIFPHRLGPPRFRLRKEYRDEDDDVDDNALTPIRLLSHPFFTQNDDKTNKSDEARLEYVPVLTFRESDTAQRILSVYKKYSNHMNLKRGPPRRGYRKSSRRKSSVDTIASDASWASSGSEEGGTKQRLACRSSMKRRKHWSRVSRRRVNIS